MSEPHRLTLDDLQSLRKSYCDSLRYDGVDRQYAALAHDMLPRFLTFVEEQIRLQEAIEFLTIRGYTVTKGEPQ